MCGATCSGLAGREKEQHHRKGSIVMAWAAHAAHRQAGLEGRIKHETFGFVLC